MIVVSILIAGAGLLGFYAGQGGLANPDSSITKENKQLAFIGEVLQIIEENYWQTMSEKDLVNLFVLASENVSGQSLGDGIENKQALFKNLEKILQQYQTTEQQVEFIATTTDMVLANLQPHDRSRLYSQQQQKTLANTVNNINPEVDQYQVLEVDKTASQEEIEENFQKKKQALDEQLAVENTPENQQKLANLQQAHNALKDLTSRQLYDVSGIEPTMEYRLLNERIFYLKIKKFSPTTVEELSRVAKKVDQGQVLNTLILDLRGNIGGAIDGLPYFLGPFIGPNQYAYQFFQQGKTKDFKTKAGWLPELNRYKRVVVLIDEATQSSAEVMASVLKKYNVGVLLGTKTMGWGTVERVFPIKEQITEQEIFSVFLVHHLTLREDGEPIEGNGVEPHINITSADWPKQLTNYYSDEELVNQLRNLLAK